MDTGWTRADEPGAELSYFCSFFAKGICNGGHDCRYYHRLPSVRDCIALDPAHDIFGRERYASHRDDLGGVGSFNSECRTLFVGELRFDRKDPSNAVRKVEEELMHEFGKWGQVEELRVIPSKAIAFVRYAYRGFAEFAKVAMADQRLGLANCIRVKWGLDDPNPKTKRKREEETRQEVREAIDQALVQRGLSIAEVKGVKIAIRPPPEGVTDSYPDTAAQFKRHREMGFSSAEAVVATAIEEMQAAEASMNSAAEEERQRAAEAEAEAAWAGLKNAFARMENADFSAPIL
mmetsp:Transcript_21061/g.31490  ORF Transcript_21061/g.31490 Transcript_21061/m.31490 type:complete len:291 (-) Transcript_21061:184-1056(-)